MFAIDQLRSRQRQQPLPVLESWNEAKKQNQLCQDLEGELDRLERIHAEKLWTLRANDSTADSLEYNLIRTAEFVARHDLEIARAELEQQRQLNQTMIGQASDPS